MDAARDVNADDKVGTQTSSALEYSIKTGQGAGIRSVAQVTSHLNRSLAILMKKKQPIDLENPATATSLGRSLNTESARIKSPKAQAHTRREISPEEHIVRSKSISHNINRKYCINKLFK